MCQNSENVRPTPPPLPEWGRALLAKGEKACTQIKTRPDRVWARLSALRLALFGERWFAQLWETLGAGRTRVDVSLDSLVTCLAGPSRTMRVTHRTLQRWARDGNIPGAFQPSQGDYRIRVCPEFCRWLLVYRVIRDTKEICDLFPPEWVGLGEDVLRFEAIKTRKGVREMAGDPNAALKVLSEFPHDPHKLKRIQNTLGQYKAQLIGKRKILKVLSAIDELESKGEPITNESVAEFLKMRLRTFYRHKYNELVQSHVPRAVPGVSGKTLPAKAKCTKTINKPPRRPDDPGAFLS